MAVIHRDYFSPNIQNFNPLIVQLSDSPLSRYTIVRIFIPERPIPPSQPSFDSLPLPKVDAVPEDLQEDPLFQEHTDPISYEPILDPVTDKNEPKHIYERATIVQWLKDHQTSPLTRRPMTEADLIPVPELKKKINEKIREHLLQKIPNVVRVNNQYQKALDVYYKVDLPQYENKCRSLSWQARISLVATTCFTKISSTSFNSTQSLQGRVTVLSLTNSVASQVNSLVRAPVENIFSSTG